MPDLRAEPTAVTSETATIRDAISAEIKRGESSWNYIYVALGFAIAIEGTVVQMVEPLKFPWNILTFISLAGVTGHVFLNCGWFQNKLIGWRMRYESRYR